MVKLILYYKEWKGRLNNKDELWDKISGNIK